MKTCESETWTQKPVRFCRLQKQ